MQCCNHFDLSLVTTQTTRQVTYNFSHRPAPRMRYLAHFAALRAHGGDQHIDLWNEVRLAGVLQLLVAAVRIEKQKIYG